MTLSPDIDWESLSVRPGASDTEVQQALLDLSIEHGLSQIHEQSTRQESILDLAFTNKVSKGAKIRNRYNQVPHLT